MLDDGNTELCQTRPAVDTRSLDYIGGRGGGGDLIISGTMRQLLILSLFRGKNHLNQVQLIQTVTGKLPEDEV